MAADRRKKIFLLRVLIASATIVILTLWIFNLQNVWRYAADNAAPEDSRWAQLRRDLDKTLGDIQGQLEKAKADRAGQDKAASETVLNGVLAEAGKLAVPAATSTETGTAAEAGNLPLAAAKDCPAYIDCMPTVGAARPCVIPAGCEGLTTIAY